MYHTFGAEYLERIETPVYGGVVKWWDGCLWRGSIVCADVGPCKFIPEEPIFNFA